ncbi:hypothetical protein Z949_1491 [Sulfitobacter guttiformis KCTC 32187]|nr:hypothetical protein Z949_1491 [Sulfitobacter guttiformis KCTC 32187]
MIVQKRETILKAPHGDRVLCATTQKLGEYGIIKAGNRRAAPQTEPKL